jgi:hypothetical protein
MTVQLARQWSLPSLNGKPRELMTPSNRMEFYYARKHLVYRRGLDGVGAHR